MKNWENKTSTDCDDINMLLVKQVINCIAKPIMYIYNLSFTTGEFTEYNENSKSTHNLSLGISISALIIYIFQYYHSSQKYYKEMFISRLEGYSTKHELINPRQ